jgi:hypothetical protein
VRDAGQWFEGPLGTDVSSFDTDVDVLLSDAPGAITEDEFRLRATAVRDHIIRVLTP